MRSDLKGICLGACVAIALAATGAVPALAWSRNHDRVYADSFGNLVIDSAAGYKRIIVGEGSLARQMSDYTAAGSPHVGYLDREAGLAGDCYRTPAFVKGRSYMYGLSDGEMPDLTPCR